MPPPSPDRRARATALALALALACRPDGPTELPPPSPAATRTAVGPGDQIEIRVFDEDRFDGEYEVEENGTIDFPLVGTVRVAGMTAAEISQALEQRLADGFLQNPQVTAMVKTRSNREVSVLGQVNEPGSFPWQERLTLVQAVSLAGGLTPFAAPRQVKIRRTGADGQTTTIKLSLDRIVNGKADDVQLQPGDVVFVPESPI